jgi:hypothetical protein
MPLKKAPEANPNRLRTRPWNANIHPGTAAKDALRARNPPRDPEVIQKEKVEKEAKKEAKQKKIEETQDKEKSAARFVEEYRVRKVAEALNENAAIPRQKSKGQRLNIQK